MVKRSPEQAVYAIIIVAEIFCERIRLVAAARETVWTIARDRSETEYANASFAQLWNALKLSL